MKRPRLTRGQQRLLGQLVYLANRAGYELRPVDPMPHTAASSPISKLLQVGYAKDTGIGYVATPAGSARVEKQRYIAGAAYARAWFRRSA